MTRQEDNSVLYAVYGTLRNGYGNNRLLQAEGVEFLGEIKTEPKFTMYSLGGFPGVAEKGNTQLTVEIFKVTNEEVIRRVNNLEGYTGTRNNPSNWYDTCELQTEWGVANMFTMNNLSDRGTNVVESGDWNKR